MTISRRAHRPRTDHAGDNVAAAIQARRELVPGVPMTGFECTVGVEDLKATIAAIESHSGKIVAGPFAIPTLGDLVFLFAIGFWMTTRIEERLLREQLGRKAYHDYSRRVGMLIPGFA